MCQCALLPPTSDVTKPVVFVAARSLVPPDLLDGASESQEDGAPARIDPTGLAGVKGSIVTYPLWFLHDEDLAPSSFTVAQVAPEIYL